jgi:hypothetical protein
MDSDALTRAAKDQEQHRTVNPCVIVESLIDAASKAGSAPVCAALIRTMPFTIIAQEECPAALLMLLSLHISWKCRGSLRSQSLLGLKSSRYRFVVVAYTI